MEYKIEKAKFANDPLYDTLAALQRSLEQQNLQLYVVGACARDIAMKVLNVQMDSIIPTNRICHLAMQVFQKKAL